MIAAEEAIDKQITNHAASVIDEVAIYINELSPSEVEAHYNAGKR